MRFPLSLVLACWGIMLLSQQGHTAQHALLIGVDYQDCQLAPQAASACPTPLYGPRHDVAALKRLRVEQYQFPASHITTLLNAAATRDAILTALRALQHHTVPGDGLFPLL